MKLTALKAPLRSAPVVTLCAIVFSLALVDTAHAATILALTADTVNSDTGLNFGGAIANVNHTLSDSFAYNPDTPTVPLPDRLFSVFFPLIEKVNS